MWKIEHIFDGEYGCEERVQPVVVVTLKMKRVKSSRLRSVMNG